MAKFFIPVEEARQLIEENCQPLSPVQIPLRKALHTVLSTQLVSPVDIPSFDQSAMDGYAFAFKNLTQDGSLTVKGESFAGIDNIFPLQPNTAARIFTGAPMPFGADTVVMQEHVEKAGDGILINSPALRQGDNVRKRGAEITQGELALEQYSLLTPGAIGFLAGLGIDTVHAYPHPKVKILITGNELVPPGTPIGTGQVYESNSFSLYAALQQMQVTNVEVQPVKDNAAHMTEAVAQSLQVDVLLVTGGVSVGDYDYVLPALENCGVETIFHKVKQRPGKPLYFGKKDSCIVFGLPGNPSSVLSCFYMYVLPAICRMMNRRQRFLKALTLPLENKYSKNTALTHFLKGYYANGSVKHLHAQESFRLSSFAVANCVVEIPEETSEIKSGEIVKVHVII